jgi:hypothetical protein
MIDNCADFCWPSEVESLGAPAHNNSMGIRSRLKGIRKHGGRSPKGASVQVFASGDNISRQIKHCG